MKFKDFLQKKLDEENQDSSEEKEDMGTLSAPYGSESSPLEDDLKNSSSPLPSPSPAPAPAPAPEIRKPVMLPVNLKASWKASKSQIMDYWKTLRGNQMIPMKPIKYKHKGSTYGEDGIRITGSPNFIQAVLGKLRELLRYEGPDTKLAVVYRQTMSKKRLTAGLNPSSFVFYIQAKERGKKRRK